MSITGIRAARAYVELVMNDSKFMRGLALAESEMRAFANKCTSIGTQAFGAGAAMLTPITYAVKQFKEFDDTMRLVRAVTRATMTDFQKLSDKARLLGKTTSFTSQQVADAMANLGRAGFDTRQIDGMIKHVMNLARATQTGIANSAEIVGNAMRQFGLETKDTQRVVDVLTTTANNSSQTLDDIAQSMKYAAPVAKEFKMAIEETAYYIGILANQGLKGEMAGTSLRNMLIRLSGADVEKQFTEQLNVKIRDAQGRVKNIKDLLHEANDAMNERGWDILQRSGWLRKVFGLRAIAGGTKFLSVGDDFKYIMDAIADSEGAAERTAKQMDEGIGGAIRITISAFQELANVVGEAVTPELMELGKWLQGVANDFITFLKYNRGVVVAWMKTAGFIAKWGGMLFVVGSAVRTLGTAFGGLVSAGKNLAAYFKAFQKDTGNLDAEMTAAGSATRKAGADFSEASAKIYDAGQKIVKTAELTAKAGAAIEKASASVQKAGTSAERASVPVKAAAQNFEAATVAARAAATAFGKISKETMAIGAAFKKGGEPMVAALKAFRQIVGFYAKSGEAVGNAVSQIGALANILTQLATSSEAAAAALGVAGPEITVQTKEMAIAGRQAAKSIAAFRGATQASSRSVKSFGETVAAADRATAGFAGKAAETAAGVGAIGDAAAKSAAEVKALQGAMAGTAAGLPPAATTQMPPARARLLMNRRDKIIANIKAEQSNLDVIHYPALQKAWAESDALEKRKATMSKQELMYLYPAQRMIHDKKIADAHAAMMTSKRRLNAYKTQEKQIAKEFGESKSALQQKTALKNKNGGATPLRTEQERTLFGWKRSNISAIKQTDTRSFVQQIAKLEKAQTRLAEAAKNNGMINKNGNWTYWNGSTDRFTKAVNQGWRSLRLQLTEKRNEYKNLTPAFNASDVRNTLSENAVAKQQTLLSPMYTSNNKITPNVVRQIQETDRTLDRLQQIAKSKNLVRNQHGLWERTETTLPYITNKYIDSLNKSEERVQTRLNTLQKFQRQFALPLGSAQPTWVGHSEQNLQAIIGQSQAKLEKLQQIAARHNISMVGGKFTNLHLEALRTHYEARLNDAHAKQHANNLTAGTYNTKGADAKYTRSINKQIALTNKQIRQQQHLDVLEKRKASLQNRIYMNQVKPTANMTSEEWKQAYRNRQMADRYAAQLARVEQEIKAYRSRGIISTSEATGSKTTEQRVHVPFLGKSLDVSKMSAATQGLNDLTKASDKAGASLKQTEGNAKNVPPVIGQTGAAAKQAGAGLGVFGTAAKTASFAVLGFARALGSMMLFSAAFQGIFWAIGKLRERGKIFTDMQENLDKLKGSFKEDDSQLQRLVAINNSHEKTNELLDEAVNIIGELQAKYGNLGLSVNRVTKSVEGLKDATYELKQAQSEQEEIANDKAIRELEKNEEKLRKQGESFTNALRGEYTEREQVYAQTAGMGTGAPGYVRESARSERPRDMWDITPVAKSAGGYDKLLSNPDWRELLEPYLDQIGITAEAKRSLFDKTRPLTYRDEWGQTIIADIEETQELRKQALAYNSTMDKLRAIRQRRAELEEANENKHKGLTDTEIPEYTFSTMGYSYPLGRENAKRMSAAELIAGYKKGDFNSLTWEEYEILRANIVNAIDAVSSERAGGVEALNRFQKGEGFSLPVIPELQDKMLSAAFGYWGRMPNGANTVFHNKKLFNERATDLRETLQAQLSVGSEEEQTHAFQMLTDLNKLSDEYNYALDKGLTKDFDVTPFLELFSYELSLTVKEAGEALRKEAKRIEENTMQEATAYIETEGKEKGLEKWKIHKVDENGKFVGYEEKDVFADTKDKLLRARAKQRLDEAKITEKLQLHQNAENFNAAQSGIANADNTLAKLNEILQSAPEAIQKGVDDSFAKTLKDTYKSFGLDESLQEKLKHYDEVASSARKAIDDFATEIRARHKTEYEGLPIEQWVASQHNELNKQLEAARDLAVITALGDDTAQRGLEKTHEYLLEILRKMDRDYAAQRRQAFANGEDKPTYADKMRKINEDEEAQRKTTRDYVEKLKLANKIPDGQSPEEMIARDDTETTMNFNVKRRLLNAEYGVPWDTGVKPTGEGTKEERKREEAPKPEEKAKQEGERTFSFSEEPVVGDWVTGRSDSGVPGAKWEPGVNQSETPTARDKERLSRIEGLRRATGYHMSIEEADTFLHERDQAIEASDRKARAEQAVDNMLEEKRVVRRNIRAQRDAKIQENREQIQFQQELWKTQLEERKREEEKKKAENAQYWEESSERIAGIEERWTKKFVPRQDKGEMVPPDILRHERAKEYYDLRDRGWTEDAEAYRKYLESQDPDLAAALKPNSEWDFPDDYKRDRIKGAKKKEQAKTATPSAQEGEQPAPPTATVGPQNIGPTTTPEDYDYGRARLDEYDLPTGLEDVGIPAGLPVPSPQGQQADQTNSFFDSLREKTDADDKKTLSEIDKLQEQYEEFRDNYGEPYAQQYMDYLVAASKDDIKDGKKIGTTSNGNRRVWAKEAREKADEIKQQYEDEYNKLFYEQNATDYDLANKGIDRDIQAARERQAIAQKMGNDQGVANEEAYIKEREQEKALNDYYKELDNIERLEKTRNKDLKDYQDNQKAVEKQEKKIEKLKKKGMDTTEAEAELAELERKRDAALERYGSSNEQYGRSANIINAMNAYGSQQMQQTLFDINRSFSSHGTFDAYETGGQDVQVWTAQFKEQTAILGNIEDYLATMASGEYL